MANIFSWHLKLKLKLSLIGLEIDYGSTGNSLVDASGRKMRVSGTMTLYVTPQVKEGSLEAPRNIKITALVTDAMGWDLLLG